MTCQTNIVHAEFLGWFDQVLQILLVENNRFTHCSNCENMPRGILLFRPKQFLNTKKAKWLNALLGSLSQSA